MVAECTSQEETQKASTLAAEESCGTFADSAGLLKPWRNGKPKMGGVGMILDYSLFAPAMMGQIAIQGSSPCITSGLEAMDYMNLVIHNAMFVESGKGSMKWLTVDFLLDALNAFPQLFTAVRDCKTSIDNDTIWSNDANKWN